MTTIKDWGIGESVKPYRNKPVTVKGISRSVDVEGSRYYARFNPQKQLSLSIKERFQVRLVESNWVRRAIDNHVEVVFEELKARWKEETKYFSSTSAIYMNDSYQKIIGLGWEAVPYILKSLERENGMWDWALRSITRENPVPDDLTGNHRAAREFWIGWGKAEGII